MAVAYGNTREESSEELILRIGLTRWRGEESGEEGEAGVVDEPFQVEEEVGGFLRKSGESVEECSVDGCIQIVSFIILKKDTEEFGESVDIECGRHPSDGGDKLSDDVCEWDGTGNVGGRREGRRGWRKGLRGCEG